MHRSSLIAAVTVLAVGLVALQYWNGSRPTPLPALARDLPQDDPVKQSTVFRQRIAQRFPIGTPSADVERELRAEGFQVKAKAGGWHAAMIERRLYPCLLTWLVRWRSNAGKVVETTGGFQPACP